MYQKDHSYNNLFKSFHGMRNLNKLSKEDQSEVLTKHLYHNFITLYGDHISRKGDSDDYSIHDDIYSNGLINDQGYFNSQQDNELLMAILPQLEPMRFEFNKLI